MTVCASLQWEFNSQDYCTDCTFRLSFSIDFNSFCSEEIRPKLCLSYAHTILVEVPPENPSSHFMRCSPQQQRTQNILSQSKVLEPKKVFFSIFRCYNIMGIQFCPPPMPIVTPNDGPQSLNMALLGPEVDIDFHDEKVSDTYSQCI